MRRDPLGGQPLGFGYLFARHPLFDAVFATLRILISLLGRSEIVPRIGKCCGPEMLTATAAIAC